MKEIVENLKTYIKANIEFVKVEVKLDFADAMSRMVLLVIFGTLLSLFLIMISLALAFYLNEVLNSSYMGFFIVSGVFFISLVVLALLNRKGELTKKIREQILSNVK